MTNKDGTSWVVRRLSDGKYVGQTQSDVDYWSDEPHPFGGDEAVVRMWYAHLLSDGHVLEVYAPKPEEPK